MNHAVVKFDGKVFELIKAEKKEAFLCRQCDFFTSRCCHDPATAACLDNTDAVWKEKNENDL